MPKPIKPDSAREERGLQARILKLQGKPLDTKQKADLQWLEKHDSAIYVELYCQNVPKGDYCKMAGRQHKVIDDTARNYDLPLDGSIVNLYDAIKAIHDLIASNSKRLQRDSANTREELESEKLRKQIEGLEWDNDKKKIDLAHAKGEAIPKSDLRNALSTLQAQLRSYGQQLRRTHPAIVDEFNDLLIRLADEIESGRLAFE